ncbi:MAG: 3-dehydroquinate synthase [Clostridiales Family XIII bacterium]|jgi:3-dehydroquinate synthase|nr:3-dehydroquinate synthase [Clostridiales Family XIII bacterium]
MNEKNTDNRILTVGLGERSYDIVIGGGVFASAGARLADLAADGAICVITDENVNRLYGYALAEALGRVGIGYETFVIPPGERSKNMATLSDIYDWFWKDGRLNRFGLVVAFGGGVVGDLAGFAAATWMRGVRFVQIPTTLLAMVDSSVGGKTGIDTARGKNLVGAFHQPSLVLIDPKLLATLPGREFGAGLAEVVKYGAIASESLFSRLEAKGRDVELADVIYECCSIKANIVEADERDTGKRALLNFGHTFGHAIELKYGFERYNHGEAVAAGMHMAACVGERLGVTESGTAGRVGILLSNLDLSFGKSVDGLIDYMRSDKKVLTDGVKLVLLTHVGDAITRNVAWNELEEAIYAENNR